MGAPVIKGNEMSLFDQFRGFMERNAKIIIALMVLLILAGAVSSLGIFSGDREDRFRDLMAAYEFVTDAETGIATWDTEEAWKEGMNQMMDLCPKELFQNNFLYGDNEVLRQMLRNIRRVKFNDKNRAELAQLVMEMHVQDASGMGMYKVKVDAKEVKEINYLTGIRMVY